MAVLACAAAVGGVVLAAQPAAAARSAASATAPACATSQLVVWIDTSGNGAAGSFYYDLELTNLSAHPCSLYGYPGVSAVSVSGRELGSPASRNPERRPATVTLSGSPSPNLLAATATVVLRITDTGVYSRGACGRVTAAGLRVYPPGQTDSKVVPFPFAACSHRDVGVLSVEAVQREAAPEG